MTTKSQPPPVHKTDGVELIERPYDHPDAARLLMAFYAEQVGRYGFADPVEADPAEFADPRGIFVVAYRAGAPVGCGGYHWYDRPASTVEIRKLYAVPEARGLGIGRAILSWLEAHAATRGARRIILETGVRNDAALGLFQAFGYQPIPRYVAGRNPKINRPFAKALINRPRWHTASALRAIA